MHYERRESETGREKAARREKRQEGRKEGRENQRTNLRGKRVKKQRNSSHFFYATGHLNKNINLGAVGLKDKIMRLKVKEIEDLKKQIEAKPHHYRANTKIRARNRYIPLKINYLYGGDFGIITASAD